MTARIYRPAKTSMQSGQARAKSWVLEFEPDSPRTTEPLMGYTSSRDMLSQVKLQFDSKEDAVRYAQNNELSYRVIEPRDSKRRTISYAANFGYDRKIPWTH